MTDHIETLREILDGTPRDTLHEDHRAALNAAIDSLRQVQDGGMLPDELIPFQKEWYRLCERRFAVERISISGEMAEAIVSTIGRLNPAPQTTGAWPPMGRNPTPPPTSGDSLGDTIREMSDEFLATTAQAGAELPERAFNDEWHAIEAVLIRRLRANKLDGYTIETAKEIASIARRGGS